MAARTFVTVGTTQFNDLVRCVTSPDILKVLHQRGCTQLTIQIGSGTFVPDAEEAIISGVSITWYRYKPSLKEDIEDANLVISHAGAGSCLEVLHAGKPLVVVINEDLMGNHQMELAEQMALLGHLVWTKVRTLKETLTAFEPSALKPYKRGSPGVFASFLDQALGIV